MVLKEIILINEQMKLFDDFKYNFDLDFKNPNELFTFILLYHNGEFKIPFKKILIPIHFMFGNFQCLRCGKCCKVYEDADVIGYLPKKLIEDGKETLANHIWVIRIQGRTFGSIYSNLDGSCSLCRARA